MYHGKFRPIYNKINTVKIAKMFNAQSEVRVLGPMSTIKKGIGKEEAFLSYHLMIGQSTWYGEMMEDLHPIQL